MKANELRQKYLDFFKSKGHAVIPSASLMPENDPSTLFTGSGMQPMVPYLLGERHPEGARITDSQKCFRSGDIDDVGNNRHTTFFEMLGNWSLGDYFKIEQITWMFEFLTQELKLDPKRIYVSVYQGNAKYNIPKDDEAVKLWQEKFKSVGIDAKAKQNVVEKGMQAGDRIFYYDEKENWWSRAGVPENMPEGEPGGPDSEMFWDFGAHLKLHENSPWKEQKCHPACDCGRFLEIGNNVFMQYIRTKSGFKELKNKNIDFGGGLERLAVAVNDNPDIFACDVFASIREKIEKCTNKKYGANSKETEAFRVIMDHLRAATFLIGDGALPANKDQGYFTRRLIRRAVRFAYHLDVTENFTKEIAETVIDEYSAWYKDLNEKKAKIIKEIDKEESKFRKTLVNGEKEFNKWKNQSQGEKQVPAKIAFDLFQSYGFPLEMTEEMAQENGLDVDIEGFKNELNKHQELSRTASAGKFKGGLADSEGATTKLHTATHLLLASLRKVLGDHIEQRGSNITAERLRFDFNHSEKMTPEQIEEVERLVNSAIQKKYPVVCKEMTVEEAKAKNAIGVFGSKYGEKVKVYTVGTDDDYFSREICGGPHVQNTGELGGFEIKKEQSSSAGIRRIKAVLK